MANYIRERSSGEIIRDSLRIYRDHFGTIFSVYFISGFLWRFIYEVLDETASWHRSKWFFFALSWLMPFVAGVLLTAVVAQIYLGNELNLKRVLRRPKVLGKALLTELLVLFLLFLYPWLMFAVPVVVLEGVWGFRAVRRSSELGRHYRVRNVFVLLWPYTVKFILWVVYALAVVFLVPYTTPWRITLFAIKDTLFSLITPLAYITSVLLYFDMRIRNEAYDIVSLAEELRK